MGKQFPAAIKMRFLSSSAIAVSLRSRSPARSRAAELSRSQGGLHQQSMEFASAPVIQILWSIRDLRFDHKLFMMAIMNEYSQVPCRMANRLSSGIIAKNAC